MARACRGDLPDGESGIFFQPKLDSANRLEMIAENRRLRAEFGLLSKIERTGFIKS
jgi:hypothetical protein